MSQRGDTAGGKTWLQTGFSTSAVVAAAAEMGRVGLPEAPFTLTTYLAVCGTFCTYDNVLCADCVRTGVARGFVVADTPPPGERSHGLKRDMKANPTRQTIRSPP